MLDKNVDINIYTCINYSLASTLSVYMYINYRKDNKFIDEITPILLSDNTYFDQDEFPLLIISHIENTYLNNVENLRFL